MTLQQLRYIIAIQDAGSYNKAASGLFISQPSLSAAVKDLEKEIGITIFIRNNRGITLTADGSEFLGYARQVMEQYRLLNERFIEKESVHKKFSVSMQHYSFAVKAFVELVRRFGMEEYEFSLYETKTYDVIEHVKNFRSEIGVLYQNEFNKKVISKLLNDKDLVFTPLFTCGVYVYLWKGNPLSQKAKLTMKDLEDYPCIAFEQGENNSFYLAEEVLSTYAYKRLIRISDRATSLNLMIELNAYTLCSGIICAELNGGDYIAIPLEIDEKMTIGYITHKGVTMSNMGKLYIDELAKYKNESL